MRITKYIWQASPTLCAVTVITGILTGITNAALITMISRALYNQAARTGSFILSFFALCVLSVIVGSASQIALGYLSRQAMAELRMGLCQKIITAPLSQLETMGTHRLIVALRDDTKTIAVALGQLPVLYMQAGVIFVCIVYLGWLSWPLLLGVLLFTGLGVISYQLPLKKANQHMRAARDQEDQVSYFFGSILHGIKELKLSRSRRNHVLWNEIEPTTEKINRSYAIGWSLYTIATAWGRLLIFVLMGVLILVMAPLIQLQSQILIGFVIMILYMSGYIQVILNILPVIAQGRVAIRKLEEVGFSLAKEFPSSTTANGFGVVKKWQRLELKQVTHRYYREDDSRSFTMGPLDLVLNPGEIVFVVGGNGSGKTTFAKLLTSLYMPEEGTILLDGKSITDENREEYREYFAAVFSDCYVFETLVGTNGSVPDQLARRYLERLQLQHRVQIEANILSTINLSSGQRKRLALLSAYLQNRPIYLFDEWAADQDPEFKRVFYEELLPEFKARGITPIVISHDHHYYSHADRIIEFDEGRIVFDQTSRGGSLTAAGV